MTEDRTTTDYANEYRTIAHRFSDLVADAGANEWDNPSPVPDWTARDVVRHLTEWFPPFLAGGAQIELPRGPSVDDDPVAAWQTLTNGVQTVLDDQTTASAPFTNPHTGTMPVAEAIYKFFAGDVFMHTWDLARATGQDDTLDPNRCEEMLAGLEPIDDILRSSGQFGPRVPVADNADTQIKLIAFIGRDPSWQPS